MVWLAQSKPNDAGRAHPEPERPAVMEALVQAAEQLLAEHGPESISALRIASRAGVSLGTLLRCFRNKDAIVAEAMARRSAAASPATRAQATAASKAHVPPPPPASALFRKPAVAAPAPAPKAEPRPPAAPAPTARRAEPKPTAAPAPTARRAEPRPTAAPAPAARRAEPAPTAAPAPAARRAEPAPPAPAAPRQPLEEALAAVVRPLVAGFAELLPLMAELPQAERDTRSRAVLRRMVIASEVMLARQQVPDPSQMAYVMMLACDKVIKDAMRHAHESFTDGRLEQALCQLCLDFVRAQ